MFVEAPRQLRRPFQKRFECLDCNLEDPTVDDRGLSNHAKTHRWCQQCAKYFRSMQDRDEHLQTCVVVCKTCGFPQHNARAQCQAYFKPYVKAVTQKLVRCREPGCQALGSDPVPPHLLKLHIKEKLELFEFFCEWPMCGQGFVQKRDLIKHIDSHEAGAGSPSPPVDDQHYSQARLYCRGYSISGLPCIMKTHRMDSLRKHERRNRHWGNPEEKEAALHGAKEKKAQRNHEPSVSLQDARRAQAPAVFRESDDDSDWRRQSAPRRSRLLLRRRAKSRPQYHEAETERSSSPYHGKPETGEQSPPPRIKKTTRRKRQRVPSEECDKNDAEHPENLPSGRLKDRRATSQKYDEPETLPSSRSRRAQAHSALQRCEACLSRPAEQRAPAFTFEQQMCYDHDNSLLCSECPMEFVRALNRKNGKRQVSCLICEKLGKRR